MLYTRGPCVWNSRRKASRSPRRHRSMVSRSGSFTLSHGSGAASTRLGSVMIVGRRAAAFSSHGLPRRQESTRLEAAEAADALPARLGHLLRGPLPGLAPALHEALRVAGAMLAGEVQPFDRL